MVRTPGTAGPTLAVVARAAGVSVPTASKVVNGRADVAPETRRRVTEALDRLGYVRRPRHDALRPPALVDLVVPSAVSSRSGAVLHGVEEAAREAGLEVVVSVNPPGTPGTAGTAGTTGAAGTVDGPGGPGGTGRPGGRGGSGGPDGRDWLDRLAARGSRGVLFHLLGPDPRQYAWLARHGVPFVLVDPVRRPPPGVVSVGAADWHGGLTATEHLLALGHERIAVVAGHRHRMRGGARVAGYRSALAAAGVRHRPEYVRYGDPGEAGACRGALDLLDLPEPPTAFFACSDRTALGVYEAAARRGLRVPEDVSVVGFDDLPEARWARPALTTVRPPLSEMAATALRLLVRMMAGEHFEGTRTELSTCLVERASTGPLPYGRARACG
ncbi:transcriptional regulator [Streptomyces minutiscleroticus]|uniref:Transcriptional regulator n=1 Tax=Streptomyces minutiscleroticus TaxID=68238 RepID=A0A918NXQ7_9ACTN|nr:LacI family DNA-binding transcriptional regulator [Streptomyces minutiscleroticus]GGY03397.1 transcriptional regulator [Streptomyces minutiscleroticus]